MENRQTYLNSLHFFIVFVAFTSLVCFVITIFCKPVIYLSENQILYIYSTISQVVGGLFGLTMTGYVFFESKLNDKSTSDKTLFDQVEILKQIHRNVILVIGIICALTIFFSICSISFYGNTISNTAYRYILNQAMLFSVQEISFIIYFGWSVLDPKKLDKLSERLKRRLEKKDSRNKNEDIDFTEFLKIYNNLEELIINFANELVESTESHSSTGKQREFRPQLLQSLKILMANKIINAEITNEINQIRQYRNYAVHGSDFRIDYYIYKALKIIKDSLQEVYDSRQDKEAREAAIKRLYIRLNEMT